jgi:hypothetical protein
MFYCNALEQNNDGTTGTKHIIVPELLILHGQSHGHGQ